MTPCVRRDIAGAVREARRDLMASQADFSRQQAEPRVLKQSEGAARRVGSSSDSEATIIMHQLGPNLAAALDHFACIKNPRCPQCRALYIHGPCASIVIKSAASCHDSCSTNASFCQLVV